MFFSRLFTSYESEATRFITELKQKHPQLEEQQRAGRSLLWDRAPLDLETTARDRESRVRQQPYVYQNH